jgi:hypothetical protein
MSLPVQPSSGTGLVDRWRACEYTRAGSWAVCGSDFGVGQTDVAGGISPAAPRAAGFARPPALSRLFAGARAIACRRTRRAFAAGAVHRQSRASNDPLADLKAQFPLLGGDVEKIWQSAVVRLSGAQSYQLLTFAESEQGLNELSRVKIPDAGKSPKQAELSELAQRKPSAAEKMALNELSQNLVFFTIRANPVMRPIVREYQQIAALLARGKGIKHWQRSVRRLSQDGG